MVGLSYFSGVEPLLLGSPELVDVLEIEPQTFWYQPDPRNERYRVDEPCLEQLRQLPFPKLVHGIGFPVGGTEPPAAAQAAPLLQTIASLQPAWFSEHLSFNRARGDRGSFQTGFLLPPRQSMAGISAAVRSIRALADGVPLPFAVETGVNYLRPRRDEVPDGAFIGEVIERADCGLILDLHNLWCNERNGRQSIDEFLRQIPLERVWEIHLAGGSALRGYWLDSHSGAVPAPLIEIARRTIPHLRNLRAVIFELFPEYLPVVGLDLIREQLELIRATCASSAASRVDWTPIDRCTLALAEPDAGPSPAEWEDTLGALVVEQPASGELAVTLEADTGIAVLRELVADFRAAMITGTLKLTMRLLLLHLGSEAVERLLAENARASTPRLFASAEADAFATHLAACGMEVPHLADVLRFERAVVDTLIGGRPSTVVFHADPLVILRSLADGRIPESPRIGTFEIEVTPPEVSLPADTPVGA